MLTFFRNPHSCRTFTHTDWADLFEQSRHGKLLSQVAHIVRKNNLEEYVPPGAQWILDSARLRFLHARRQFFWELDRIHQAVGDVPVMLLKGAAYLAGGFPWSEGRSSVDVDVLVRKEDLPEIEKRLNAAGWLAGVKDAYDEAYYRQWMHEIPPMCHIERKTVLDVHHNILPTLGRAKVDPRLLWEDAIPLTHFRIPSPCDMILHSAAHLFHDGELNNAFRDIVDLDAMFRHYLTEPDFYERLMARSQRLNLERSLFYAIRYTHRLLETPFPEDILRASRKLGGNFLTTGMMDLTVPLAIMSWREEKRPVGVSASRTLLLARAHLLRMPLRMLIPHLWTKWQKKRKEKSEHEA